MKQDIIRYHMNLQNIDEMTMWLIEGRITWRDWMEDYKLHNSSDNVIDWMRSNICQDVFDWMKQYMTKRRFNCLNEIIHNWKETCKLIIQFWQGDWLNETIYDKAKI